MATLLGDSEARRWLDLARTFGLHLTRLDIRQDARRYQEVLTEIFQAIGACRQLRRPGRCRPDRRCWPTRSISPARFRPNSCRPLTVDTLRLYRLLQRAMVRFGADCLGANVISLTQSASDVLGVLWLWRHAQAVGRGPRGQPRAKSELKIAPLFEKIGDLERAGQTLAAMLANPLYAELSGRPGQSPDGHGRLFRQHQGRRLSGRLLGTATGAKRVAPRRGRARRQADVLPRPRRLAGTRRRSGGPRHLVAPVRIARRHACG